MQIIEWLRQPWPWYIAGPLIGLMVPLLLILGNRSLGVSSSLRHICAACMPSKIPFFTYEWKKEIWNLFFVFGILLGGLVVNLFLSNPHMITVDPALVDQLKTHGITDFRGLVPNDIFNWQSLLTLKGLIMMVGGGLLVGFGTRYAGGCTSGHAIMGISTLQWPSVVATICFMAGGFLVANLVLPLILKL